MTQPQELTIKINKETLLRSLRHHREEHRKNYDAAMHVWRDELVTAADELAIVATDDQAHPDLLRGRIYDVSRCSSVPQSYADRYDTLINMIEHHGSDDMEVGECRYREIMTDAWDWSHDFRRQTLSFLDVKANRGPK